MSPRLQEARDRLEREIAAQPNITPEFLRRLVLDLITAAKSDDTETPF